MSHPSGNLEYGVGYSRELERELTVLIHTCRLNHLAFRQESVTERERTMKFRVLICKKVF